MTAVETDSLDLEFVMNIAVKLSPPYRNVSVTNCFIDYVVVDLLHN